MPENSANVNAAAATHSARSSGQPVMRLASKVTTQSPGVRPCNPGMPRVGGGIGPRDDHRPSRPRLIACNNGIP
jgi:hypothetical protein